MVTITTSTIDSTHSPIITINAATTINEKLIPSTFPQWRAQFEALLIGYDLIEFVTGTHKCPAIDVLNLTASKAANSHWIRQDKLILHAILASTSTTITPLLFAYKTSHEAWTTLIRLYAGKSRTRVMQLKEDLTLSNHGSRSVSEFLQGIKVIADELAIIDHPVSDDDLTLYILNGLGIEFRENVAPIRARETSLKFKEIHDLLVSHENYLRRLEQQSVTSFVPTTNYSNRWSPQSSFNSRHSKWRPLVAFQSPRGQSGSYQNGSFNSGHRRFKPKCQWCDQPGHTAKQCPKMSTSDFSANCAASSHRKNHKWLVDSAASHNMTTNLSNLKINSEYDGIDEVVIGDGSGLPVSHTGSLSLKSSNHVFHLRDTLYVPTIHKNLIFVHHFTKHNNVYIEFHPTYFLVKDRITGAILLKDECEDGVYPFPEHPSPIQKNIAAYIHERTTSDGWHKRLGHPSSKLLPFDSPRPSTSMDVGTKVLPLSEHGSPSAPSPLQVSIPSSPLLLDPTTSMELPVSAAVRVHSMTTRFMNEIYKPKKTFLVTKHPLPSSLEPSSVTVALADSRWREAMSSKLTALMRHNTWQLVPPPSDCNIVGCKWVFRVKRHANGSVDRFKARFVAKGFNQRPGLDYKKTFSPVVKPVTIRIVLAIVVMQGLSLRNPDHPDYVCCLTKAIYGLKQASRAWYTALKHALTEFGFLNSKSDSSLFVFHNGSTLVYCLVYVDDLIITGNNSVFVASIIDHLGQNFSIKDLGLLHFFLGVEVIPTTAGLFLTQHKYIRDLLAKTNMTGARDVTTPFSTSVALQLDDGSSSVDSTEFCQIHWTATKRLLRYLKNTIFHGVTINKTSSSMLTCFSDADWAGSLDDKKSTSAYLLFLRTTPISWSSKKQRAIARSSTEAEYRALAIAAAESVWLLSLLQELKFCLSQPPLLLCDNLGATQLSFNPVQHSRMKHIQIDIHFVRDLVAKNILNVQHVHITDQLADLLTKPLSRQ
ncbi:PREDICTED: uncharacterized protein LOC105119910 [Populus euphratica]|uniref:Uncharacterized protein LOC105119910 n=1 Tax=Populus euphratica TaxID=75702 RepID=A0AAJ6TST6_POPEU|nr:PREDICTED: uncharacterized protein LOC105119910 [Populus euphratica]